MKSSDKFIELNKYISIRITAVDPSPKELAKYVREEHYIERIASCATRRCILCEVENAKK